MKFLEITSFKGTAWQRAFKEAGLAKWGHVMDSCCAASSLVEGFLDMFYCGKFVVEDFAATLIDNCASSPNLVYGMCSAHVYDALLAREGVVTYRAFKAFVIVSVVLFAVMLLMVWSDLGGKFASP